MILYQHEQFHKYVYDTHADNMQGMIALNTIYLKFLLMINLSIHIFQVTYYSNCTIVMIIIIITHLITLTSLWLLVFSLAKVKVPIQTPMSS
jgi:hypothetical protein